ncbi:GNAT family [Gigaspora margarita]|uniref:GNAT family n=1 Tax=Gigaspora margarita TaxID=4874 RepID=A0A8H4AT48_GIGMA|nr:GNAT family [Gigaspora margarita]
MILHRKNAHLLLNLKPPIQASTTAFRRRKVKVGTGMSSSNIEGEQKTSKDWLWGRELGIGSCSHCQFRFVKSLGHFSGIMLTSAGTNRNSYMSWGYPLSILDEYVEREQILANNEFSSEILKVWILVSKEYNLSIDPESTILSQCETYKRQTLMTLSSGQIQEVIGYCITALFTPPKH